MALYAGPDMFDLMKLVIPKIMNEWFAEAFHYDISTIKTIKERECGIQRNAAKNSSWVGYHSAEVGPKI